MSEVAPTKVEYTADVVGTALEIKADWNGSLTIDIDISVTNVSQVAAREILEWFKTSLENIEAQ